MISNHEFNPQPADTTRIWYNAHHIDIDPRFGAKNRVDTALDMKTSNTGLSGIRLRVNDNP